MLIMCAKFHCHLLSSVKAVPFTKFAAILPNKLYGDPYVSTPNKSVNCVQVVGDVTVIEEVYDTDKITVTHLYIAQSSCYIHGQFQHVIIGINEKQMYMIYPSELVTVPLFSLNGHLDSSLASLGNSCSAFWVVRAATASWANCFVSAIY